MSTRRIPAASVDANDPTELVDDGRDRRLGNSTIAGEPVPFAHPPVERRLSSDPELRGLVDRLVAEAYDAGRADGLATGREEGASSIDRLAQAITLTVTDVEERMEEARQATVGGLLDLAIAIAEAVIGRTPHDDGAALVRRVEEAMDVLDERPLTLAVSASDEEAVRGAAEGIEDLAVEVDPSLSPGEGTLRGGWSFADLTHAAAWDAIRRHLDDAEDS
ncbi:MAG: FliH/SctL family protein [Actinomycetota bacterium]